MGNIVTNPKAFYITKKPEYEYIMKNGFSAAFANADATPKYKGVPFALTDAREQLGRYGDCVIPVTLDGTYEVQRMQNGIDYVFVPLDSADKIHIDAPQKSVRLSESKLRLTSMKQSINEIGNTPQGMYAIGQVAGRAYDRMLNGTKKSVGDGVVALNPKYGKVALDAAHAAAGGYMDWRKRFKEQNGREPSDEEYRAWMQNYKNGSYDYGKPESEKRGIVKISESQLRNMIAESVKGILNEIGDTPAGQWMLGRLAGRQRNREYPEEISSYTMPVRKQGKITKTTIDANTYGDNDYDSAFQRGRDLENSKWRDNYPDYDQYHADEREESLRGFGDAMASMIRHHANKTLKESVLRKIIAESMKKVLKEREYNRNEGWFLYTEINNDGAEVLRISDNRGDFDYWRKNGGKVYGQYPSYEEAAKAMRYFASNGFRRINGDFVKM